MDKTNDFIEMHLSSDQRMVTEGYRDVYRVKSGSIFVFIAPMKKGSPYNLRPLCEAKAGDYIPSLNYTDGEYTNWRFVFMPKDDAELVYLPDKATGVLQRNFARRVGLVNYEVEGFERSLIEAYNRNMLKEGVVIRAGEKQKTDVDIANWGVIKNSFSSREERIVGNDPLYRAIAYACRHASIDLIEEKRLSALCRDKLTVASVARAARFGCRDVVLEKDWYRKDCGVLVGNIDGRPVACVPKGTERYTIFYGDTCTSEELTGEIAETVNPRANLLCRTLPGKSLTKKDLIAFGRKSIRRADLLWVIVLGLVGALIGILLPMLNQKIYDEYIPLGDYGQLVQICVVIATFMIGNLFFDMVKSLCEFRIGSHISYDIQNAVYYRVLHLPESFFRRFESADLAQRLSYASALANSYVSSTLMTGLATVFSLLYLYRMFKYASKLAWWALVMLAIYAGLLFLLSKSSVRYDRRIEKTRGDASGKLYQFLNGIEKIRMAGVEDRAAYEYLIPFADKQSLEISKNRVTSVEAVLSGAVSVIFSMVFYLVVVKNKVSITSGGFMGFNSAFGAFSSAILAQIGALVNIIKLRPMYERLAPVLEEAEEDEGEKEVVDDLKGGVSFDHVRFSYDKNGTNVLTDLDLKIEPGDYVGIVGPSGCGKSTMLKLLLGFEEPDSGQICYDDKNLKQLDKREVRKNLGVVLQNGRLIAGSIYENITITAPHATLKEVNQVIEAVGLKEDIAQMPMGVHTVLSESSGTISGGQQQRILIARAIISHPAILIFDEATSALDNVTQAAVCASLDKMDVTRIVVAHRLSTIKNCKRIVVLHDGRIAETGTYEELMGKHGMFYQLASRQLVD